MKKLCLAVLLIAASSCPACAEIPVWRILWIILPRINSVYNGVVYEFQMTDEEIEMERSNAQEVEKFIEASASTSIDVQITPIVSQEEVTSLSESGFGPAVNAGNLPYDVARENILAAYQGRPYAFVMVCYKLYGEALNYAGISTGCYARVRFFPYTDIDSILQLRLHELMHCFDFFYADNMGCTMPITHDALKWGYIIEEAETEGFSRVYPEEEVRYYRDTFACKVCVESEDRYIGISPEMWQYVPGSTQYLNGHTYQLFTERRISWEDAKEYCEALGGHLATITTPEENALFPNIMNAEYVTNDYYWLGGVKNSGRWQWVTGEKFSYSSFKASENEAADGYIRVRKGISSWDIISGHYMDGDIREQFFICEWDYIREDLNTAPTVTTASLPEANSGVKYCKQLYSAGVQPVTWTITGLPAGLSWNANGVISGEVLSTVTEGNYEVMAVASNTEGQGTKIFTLRVGQVIDAPKITGSDSVEVVIGEAFTHTFTASGTPPVEWKLDYVPEGFSFDRASGTLTGTAKYTGYSEFGVYVSNQAGSDTRLFTLYMKAADNDSNTGENNQNQNEGVPGTVTPHRENESSNGGGGCSSNSVGDAGILVVFVTALTRRIKHLR